MQLMMSQESCDLVAFFHSDFIRGLTSSTSSGYTWLNPYSSMLRLPRVVPFLTLILHIVIRTAIFIRFLALI